jgi:hypothetical protein
MIDYTELVAIVSIQQRGGASRAARQLSSKKSFPFIHFMSHAHMGRRIQPVPVYWLPVWKNTPQATNFEECFLTCILQQLL